MSSPVARLPFSHVMFLLISSCLIILFSPFCMSDSLPIDTLPAIGGRYSTIIETNYLDKGYSMSYNEYFDADSGNFRIDGRYTSGYTYYMYFPKLSKVYLYSPQALVDNDKKCHYYLPHPNEATSLKWGPSAYMFQMFNNEMFQWTIETLDYDFTDPAPRGIPSTLYKTSLSNFNIPPGTSIDSPTFEGQLLQLIDPAGQHDVVKLDITIEYYVALYQRTAGGVVPVRVHVTSSFVTSFTEMKTIDFFIDFTLWTSLEFYGGNMVFNIPPGCPLGETSSFTYTLPDTTYVPAQASSDPPVLPKQFYMVLEAKFLDPYIEQSQIRVRGTIWNVDLIANKEKLDYLDSNENFVSLIYDYSSNLLGDGTVYRVANGQQCISSTISPQNRNPLQSVRSGSIWNLFHDNEFMKNAVYIGTQSARGVVVDVFRIEKVLIYSNDASYNFTMDLHFLPTGWTIIGHPKGEGERSLLRVVNNGTRTRAPSNVPQVYYETWDVFQYAAGAPPAHIFERQSLYCMPVNLPPHNVFPPDVEWVLYDAPGNTAPVAQYTSTVEFVSHLQGYTLSYTEYVDNINGLYRSDGKLGAAGQTELIDIKNERLYQINLTALPERDPHSFGFDGGFTSAFPALISSLNPNNCKQGSVKDHIWPIKFWDLSTDNGLQQSLDYLLLINQSRFEYQGETLHDRGMIADYWKASLTVPTDSDSTVFTINQIVYFEKRQLLEVARIPISTDITGLFVTNGERSDAWFHITLNWLNFQWGAPTGTSTGIPLPITNFFQAAQVQWSTIADKCPEVNWEEEGRTNSIHERFPIQTTPAEETASARPQFPLQFSMLFEAVIAKSGEYNFQTRHNVRWYVDIPNGRERFDIAPAINTVLYKGNSTSSTVSDLPYSLVIFYDNYKYGNKNGTMYRIESSEDGVITTCSPSMSPAAPAFSPSFINMFTDPSYFNTFSQAFTTDVRGMSTARFSSPLLGAYTATDSNGFYTIKQEAIYMASFDWVLAGRRFPASQNLTVPVQVKQRGQYTPNDAFKAINVEFNYDIYQFLPFPPTDRMFDVITPKCYMPPPPTPPPPSSDPLSPSYTSSGRANGNDGDGLAPPVIVKPGGDGASSAGLIIAAVLGSLALVFVICLGAFLYRRHQAHKRAREHIRLDVVMPGDQDDITTAINVIDHNIIMQPSQYSVHSYPSNKHSNNQLPTNKRTSGATNSNYQLRNDDFDV